ncbi:MAG: hypothetical protein CME06_18215 [Gemmatimonadetes bacterium]|nr:hypothetical protein [Gemmatimonadota bacterium]
MTSYSCANPYPVLINCTIVNNFAGGGGGGFALFHDCSPSFQNCIITANSANLGGGVSCWSSSTDFRNCTIAGNSAEDGGGISCWSDWMSTPAEPVLTNGVLWGNTPGAVYYDPDDPG